MVLVCSLSVALSTAAVAGPAGVQEGAGASTADTSVADPLVTASVENAVQADDDSAENETVRHRHPDEYGDDGDLDSVQAWLAGWMSDRLGESSIQLSQGEYDLASEIVGEEYRERLGQYVEVAGETDGESSEDEFEDAGEDQEEFVSLLEQFEETRADYEEALEEGDTERARELARELVELAAELEEVSVSLEELFAEIEEVTDEDLTEPRELISQISSDVQSETEDIVSEEFVETDLRVEIEQERISFLEPLRGAGQVTTAEGEQLANETIWLAVANETTQVETDDAGEFAFEYRPTDLPLNTSSLTIEYVPDIVSIYLGSQATVEVTVGQVEPRIVDLSGSDQFAFGDESAVSGELLVDDVPVDGVTLDVLIDGQQIGTVGTSDGSFHGTVTLPASIPDGEQTLAVRLPEEDRALAGVSAAREVVVSETETTLSLDATHEGDDEVAVSGMFETTDGLGVEGESVEVSVDGTTATTVTTDENGEFSESITVSTPDEGDAVTVQVSYRESASNLGDAEDEATVTLPVPGPGESGSDIWGLSTWLWIAGGSLLVFLALVLWRLSRSGRMPVPDVLGGSTGGPDRESPAESAAQPAVTDADSSGPTAAESLLQHASEQLQDGRPDVAVQACYSAVRENLGSRFGTAGALTHWEFYQQYRGAAGSDTDDSSHETLREVTEEYERATFSREEISLDSAQRVFERARELCRVDDVDSPDSHSSADD